MFDITWLVPGLHAIVHGFDRSLCMNTLYERSCGQRARTNMDIVDPIKHSMLTLGTAPVLWLMILLSAASLAVILERSWFFRRTRADIESLVSQLAKCLRDNDLEGARTALTGSHSAEAAVVSVGLREIQRGANATREAMASAALLQKRRLEQRLNYLGTLASNAPFIGLFGTVVGIIMAFDQLSQSRSAAGSASTAVMASIAEALVTTAIGIGIAVPAVVAFNVFQKRIQLVNDQTAALGHVLLAHIEGERPSASKHAGPARDATTHNAHARHAEEV
jgi:biopolymer transport protein ExbB